jgi:hypothetical protein
MGSQQLKMNALSLDKMDRNIVEKLGLGQKTASRIAP